MQISIFLAKFFSIYFLVISLAILLNTNSFRQRAHAFVQQDAALLLGAIIALIMGIILILMHSIWVYDWRLLVTALVWLTFIKGLVYLIWPKVAHDMVMHMKSLLAFRVCGLVCLIFAGYLGYHGFGL